MAEELMDYLKGRSPSGFAMVPHYFPDGDFVSFYVNKDRPYAERVDELLTIYRSMKTNDLIGCKIKGVRRILQTLDSFTVLVDDGKISLGMMFMAAALQTDPADRKHYKELARLAKDQGVDSLELQKALKALAV